jgi:hypothetical protein
MPSDWIFKVGDFVRIKNRSDMIGSPRCGFPSEMRYLSGHHAVITGIKKEPEHEASLIWLRFRDLDPQGRWSFSTDMIEPSNERF